MQSSPFSNNLLKNMDFLCVFSELQSSKNIPKHLKGNHFKGGGEITLAFFLKT